jgi:hypothetical protein
MDFATPQQIIEATCSAFNKYSDQIGYKARASVWLPVTAEDILQNCSQGCPRPVSHCRELCIYIIVQHALIRDAFSGCDKRMTFGQAGKLFGNGRAAAYQSMLAACSLLARPAFGSIYRDAIQSLSMAGLALWSTPQRMDCDAA